MSEVLDFFRGFNLQMIISLGIMLWYFNREISLKIDNLDKDIREMNSRVSRLEGTVYGKDVYKKDA